jgi:hypothetical protein
LKPTYLIKDKTEPEDSVAGVLVQVAVLVGIVVATLAVLLAELRD